MDVFERVVALSFNITCSDNTVWQIQNTKACQHCRPTQQRCYVLPTCSPASLCSSESTCLIRRHKPRQLHVVDIERVEIGKRRFSKSLQHTFVSAPLNCLNCVWEFHTEETVCAPVKAYSMSHSSSRWKTLCVSCLADASPKIAIVRHSTAIRNEFVITVHTARISRRNTVDAQRACHNASVIVSALFRTQRLPCRPTNFPLTLARRSQTVWCRPSAAACAWHEQQFARLITPSKWWHTIPHEWTWNSRNGDKSSRRELCRICYVSIERHPDPATTKSSVACPKKSVVQLLQWPALAAH